MGLNRDTHHQPVFLWRDKQRSPRTTSEQWSTKKQASSALHYKLSIFITKRAPAPTLCLQPGINLHRKGYYLRQYWRRMTEKSRGRAAIRTWRRSASVVAESRPRGLHPTAPSTETSEEQCPAPSITPRCAACQIYHTNSSLSPLLPTLCATPLRLASASPRHLTLAPHCCQPCPTIATLSPTHGPPHTSRSVHTDPVAPVAKHLTSYPPFPYSL